MKSHFYLRIFKNDKTIFFLMLICVVVSAIILNFSYGLYQNYSVMKHESLGKTYEIPVSLRDSSITKSEVKKYITGISSQTNNDIIAWSFQFEKDNITFDSCVTVRNNIITTSKIYGNNLLNYSFITEGRYFYPSEEENSERVALVHDDNFTGHNSETDKFPIKENKVTVFGEEFEIIGKQNKTEAPMIPFSSIDDESVLNSMYINFESRITKSRLNELTETAEKILGDRIHIPNINLPDNNELYLYNTVMFISVVISLISAANIAILYRYILIKRRKEIAVFRICGCTKTKAVLIYIKECMALIMPAAMISTIIFHLFILPSFSNTYPYMAGAFNLPVYSAIIGIFFLASLIVLVTMVSGEANKSVVAAVKGGEQ